MSVSLHCSDVLHATRSAQPGWRDILATGDRAIDGLLCDACVEGRKEIAPDATHGSVFLAFRSTGGYVVGMPLIYPSGEVVGFAYKASTLAEARAAGAITVAELAVLNGTGGAGINVGANLLRRLAVYARDNGTPGSL